MSETNVAEAAISEMSASIGKERISIDKPTRVCYSITHGSEFLLHEDYFNDFLPDAVVHPSCTEDVQEIVKIANAYKVPLIPSGGRSGSCGAEGMPGGIVIDMCGMDKILELNERNYRITAEAGVRMIDLVGYLKKQGYMAIDWPDSDEIATLGSRAAVNGYNWWENRWGSAGVIIQGLEIVLPNGNVIKVGRGSNKPTKSSLGWNLMDLFIGSRGTLGIITKVTETFTDLPPASCVGAAAFHTFKDAIESYFEFKKAKYSNTVWRVTCNVNSGTEFPNTVGKNWPSEIAMTLNYVFHGESYEVEGMKKIAQDIVDNHNGFLRPEIDEMASWWNSHSSEWRGIEGKVTNLSLGFASHLFGGKVEARGFSARPIFLDPNIPDSSVIDYYYDLQKLLATIQDRKAYPNLSQCAKVHDFGALIPGVRGFNKMWIVIHVFRKNLNEKSRKEFLQWYEKHIELVERYGGVISTTHAWIPRQIEVQLMKKTMGKNEYDFMIEIKKTIDPNGIMNPKIIF